VQDVVLLEPVHKFIMEAWARGCTENTLWKGIASKDNSVDFYQGILQEFSPSQPTKTAKSLGRIGFTPSICDSESGFDVVWCQWCLGHLSDVDLISFLKLSKKALRKSGTRQGRSLIVVKENLCSDPIGGGPRTVFDEQDSSLTRCAVPRSRGEFG
jgi:protein N-terminal methyltransferase